MLVLVSSSPRDCAGLTLKAITDGRRKVKERRAPRHRSRATRRTLIDIKDVDNIKPFQTKHKHQFEGDDRLGIPPTTQGREPVFMMRASNTPCLG